jgi:hypothetical protein
MLIDELIEVVEKKRKCEIDKADCNKDCFTCDCALTVKQVKEMYADIQMRLKHEKWMQDKMQDWDEEDGNGCCTGRFY